MKVRIVQCLCPARHCIVAIAYEPGKSTAPDPDSPDLRTVLTRENASGHLRRRVELLLAMQAMNPYCGICGAREWTYEDRPTGFETMAEAMPHLEKSEAEQRQTAALLKRHGRN
jgi:hypothetical protein